MKKGFSPTTFILVVILLAAVVGISRVVNPPPAAPPAPEKTEAQPVGSTSPGAKKPGDEMEMRKKMMQEKAKLAPKPGAAPQKPKFDPNSIEVKPSYFDENPDGKEGIKQMDEKVDKAKAEEAAARAAREAEKKAAGAITPTPTPATPAPK